MNAGVEHRARIHAALAEPHRLAIVEELLRSDRSPKELADLLAIPTNLLAHHLESLEAVGLVERFGSSGDRRRRYVKLRRQPLEGLNTPTPAVTGSALFICTHNSARSQLASALWTKQTGKPATSAGTQPANAVNPGAVAAALRVGLDIGGAEPKLLVGRPKADVVVTVCDRAHEELSAPPEWLHWSIPDPIDSADDEAFDRTVVELCRRISDLTTPASAGTTRGER